jgi:hypothetical protein
MILRVAKGKGIHATLKAALLFSPILKGNPDLARTALVAVYQHHRPFAVGPMQGIGGYESVPSIILDVACGWKDGVDLVAGLHPFACDELAGKELRKRLKDFIVAVYMKHSEGSRRVITSAVEP